MAVRPDVLDDRIGLVPRFDGLLANERLDIVIRDLDARLHRERLERELTGDRLPGLTEHLARE